jgi:mycothiol synthase
MGVAAGVRRVVEAAARHDGRAPLDEATLLSLRHRGLDDSSLWVFSKGADVVGFALAAERGEGPVEVSLVVDPGARGQGVASALAAAVLAAYSGAEMSAWSHGNHPAAARLAACARSCLRCVTSRGSTYARSGRAWTSRRSWR